MVSKLYGMLATLFALGGCSHDAITKQADRTAPTARPENVAVAPSTPSQDELHRLQAVTKLLGLDAEIVRLCNLHPVGVTPTQPEEGAPRFDTDESSLTAQDTGVLDQVADCLITGPLAGRHLQLVGRADTRGTTEYNFVLGEHRASAVSDYLEKKGVSASRIRETSRGELDATGTDDVTMRDDRRVDILLGS